MFQPSGVMGKLFGLALGLTLSVAVSVALLAQPVHAQSPVPAERGLAPEFGAADAATAGTATSASQAPIPFVGTVFPIYDDSTLEEVQPSVAYNSQRLQYFTVWSNDRPGNDDIRGQRISTRGTAVGGPFYISAGPGAERHHPDVAYGTKADLHLVVWEHDDGTKVSIRGLIVTGTGQPVSGEIAISSGPALKNCLRPAVAYAYTSDKFLVVWERHVVASTTWDIEAQVISATGTPEGNNFLVATGTNSFSHSGPDVAYNRRRNEHLVVWERLDKGSWLIDITSRRVRGNGELLFPESVDVVRVTTSNTEPAVAALPTVTADGQYLAVWETHYAPGNRNIYGRFVNGDGTMGTQVYIAFAGEEETLPAVAGNELARRYVVTWLKDSAPPPGFRSVRMRTIGPDGKPDGGDVAVGALFSGGTAVAAGPPGDFLAVFDDIPLTGNKGIFGRMMGHHLFLSGLVR